MLLLRVKSLEKIYFIKAVENYAKKLEFLISLVPEQKKGQIQVMIISLKGKIQILDLKYEYV